MYNLPILPSVSLAGAITAMEVFIGVVIMVSLATGLIL
jgi:hypothetical protein